MKPKIVAVDGPAGSGKSSICSQVCAKIGWTYVNTGAIYRAVGVVARSQNIDLENEVSMSAFSSHFAADAVWDPIRQRLYYKGEDLTEALGSAQAARDASFVARQPRLRDRLLSLQRRLGLEAPLGAIVDGRDIGTVVFPDADLKIFMTASLRERARRRLIQLRERLGTGQPATHSGVVDFSAEDLQRIETEIAARDAQDSQRSAAPLKQADDAVVVDTSTMTAGQTVDLVVSLLEQGHLLVK